MPSIGYANRSYYDYDGEVGTLRVYVPVFDAAGYAANSAAITTLWSAIDAITLGGLWKHEMGNRFTDPNPVTPADPTAQRELKWLVQYHDSTTGKKYSTELPCADPAQLDPNDRAHAEIGDAGVVDAFVTAFEAIVKSEAGNAVVVDEITLVGRRI